ncbi:hypothetical protein [Mycetocola zhadangensis]|nr:hypothetical protein [Mycetocola zhadangensis]
MTNSHTPGENGAAKVTDDQGADYTTTGEPIDDAEHRVEEEELHATPGNPLSGADETADDVDRTTVGNPISSVAHEAEEDVSHATPGNNSSIPED